MPFKGRVCVPCMNKQRRYRYRYDPFYRLRRVTSRQKAYDTDKQRQRMRDYRLFRRVQLDLARKMEGGQGEPARPPDSHESEE